MFPLKRVIRAALPKAARDAIDRRRRAVYTRLTTRGVFEKIYRDGVWGRAGAEGFRFYSGSGSHDEVVTDAYVSAVSRFLAEFDHKPDVVDLGCGDFRVGARLRDLCGAYIACDIVEPLIEFNRSKFAGCGVDFRLLDLSADELPDGRIAFIRQVLQHLSNETIVRAVSALSSKYEYLVVTEHLPTNPGFQPNIDKMTGPDNRVKLNSGVVLTSPPFNLEPHDSIKLCEVADDGGLITTMLYRMKR